MFGDVFEECLTLWFACRHPVTPFGVKALAVLLAAYVISPLDLIPEVLGLLGILDDLLLVPIGVRFLLRRVPPEAMRESRFKAHMIRAKLRR